MAVGGVGGVVPTGYVLVLMDEFTTVNSPVSREGDISKACDIDELSRPLRYIFSSNVCVFCYYRRSPPRWSQENGLNIFN